MNETNFAKELGDFYQRLQDDESRSIFKRSMSDFFDKGYGNGVNLAKGDSNRSVASASFEPTDSDSIDEEFREYLNELLKHQKSGKKIILYGAGVKGHRVKNCFEQEGIKVDLFCDRNPAIQKSGYLGLTVISPDELVEKYTDSIVIITTDYMYISGIKSFFESKEKSNVYDFLKNDEVGYFNWSFLKPVEDEIYVDCGVCRGETIDDFLKFSGGRYERIYGFEPDMENYTQTIKTHGKYDNIKLVNKGTWSDSTTLSFCAAANSSSFITDNGTSTISVTTIDETVGDDDVTFIKMDIEGAELQALRGAAKTIARCHPRLAICVYHKPEYIIELPLYIQSLVPEYRFYLRPHVKTGRLYCLYAVKE